MRVLVDTGVWSLSFRRHFPPVRDARLLELLELLKEGRADIIGSVRQELLSGVKSGEQFNRLRESLRHFEDTPLIVEDYERAAEFFNRCRAHGIQGSPTDLLVCAVADRREMSVFTTDEDFRLYARHIRIRFHEPRPEFRP